MKKILCLIDGLSLGGAERQLIGLAYFLQCKGYPVELCSYLKRDFYNDMIMSYGLKSVCLEVEGGKLAKFKAVRKYIIKGGFDCVIAYKGGATFAACLTKLFGGRVKLIVSERNTNLSRNRNDDFKFWLYSFADFIVPNSYSQQSFILKYYPRLKNKVVTITNFTDTNQFSFTKNSSPNDDLVKIVVAARIASQKNIPRFLSVVKRLKEANVKFLIKWFGDASFGECEHEEKCKKLVDDYGIADVFLFLPATKNILLEYQQCDAFCLPSIYEGYPNVVCEAMSCGKPILCSRVCDNPTIVEEGVNGFMFNPLDENEMYDVIYKFIMLPDEEKEKMGVNSRVLAEEKFSEEAFVNKYIDLIER